VDSRPGGGPRRSGIGPRERAALRLQLLGELDRVRGQVAGFRSTLDGLLAAADLEPPDDEHDPDGTTAYERAQVASLLAEADRRASALEQALASIDEPGFGICGGCGEPIGVERLQAVPGTERCVRCAGAGR